MYIEFDKSVVANIFNLFRVFQGGMVWFVYYELYSFTVDFTPSPATTLFLLQFQYSSVVNNFVTNNFFTGVHGSMCQ
jgi:hypothetical protein